MADPIVVTPPAAAAPVVETPAAKPPTAEEKFAVRKAEWVAKQVADAAAPDPTPAPAVEAKVDMDPETLKKLTEASEKARAATKRADAEQKRREEVEASQADVVQMREAVKLWKAGDRIEAIKKLSAVEDPSADIEDLLQKWVAAPAKDGEVKLTPAEIKALQDEAAEGKKFREAEQARAQLETNKKNAGIFAAQQRDLKAEDGTARYPLASLAENAETSATVALEKANAKLLKLGSPTVTRELAEHLFELAYAEIEANLAKAAPAPATLPPVEQPRPAVRAAVVPRAGAVPAPAKNYPRTPEGARERLMDRAKALTESKGERWS